MRACWVMLLLAAALTSAAAPDAVRNDAETRSRFVKAYGQLPLSFEENHGQTDSRVKFLSRGSGYSLSLTPGEAVLALPSAAGSTASLRLRLVGANALSNLVGLDELPGKSNYFIGNDPMKFHPLRSYIPVVFRKARYHDALFALTDVTAHLEPRVEPGDVGPHSAWVV